MGNADDFFRWNDEVRRLTRMRSGALAPQERRRLERRIEAAESRAFTTLRRIARSVRDSGSDAATYWDAVVEQTLTRES